MATTGIVNGTLLTIEVDGDKLLNSTSASLSLTLDTPEATTKDSGGFQDLIAGVKSGEISFEGLLAYDSGSGVQIGDISGELISGTSVTWEFSTDVSGDDKYSGNGFISSIEITADMEAPVSYSGTIVTTGTITQGVVA
jgi:predicted secreted protein